MKTRIFVNVVFMLVLTVIFAIPLQAAVYYVDTTGSGAGTDWGDAVDLQGAIASAGNGDQIWVKQGTYTLAAGATNSFELSTDGVEIYGGFAGTETNLSDRPVGATSTLNGGNNHYHVVKTTAAITNDTILDGFTITGGNASEATSPDRDGAGMYNNGSPTIRNCTFSSNTASYSGGGIFNNNTSPTIEDCIFQSNFAYGNYRGGGGIYNYQGSPIIKNCTFNNNSAESSNGRGGGVYNENSAATLVSCTFRTNSAPGSGGTGWGGGLHSISSNSLKLTNCTFSNNSAKTNGGGMSNNSSSPTVTNCTFSGNTASTGNGIYNYSGSNPTIKNTIINDGYDGTINSGGYNLSNPSLGDPTDADLTNLTLGSFDSATGTYPLIFTASPSNSAIDGGDGDPGEPYDQRGELFNRIVNGTVDIGAYEYSDAEIAVSETGNIADGGNFDFGMTPVGTPVSKTFTITNEESGAYANLSVGNLSLPSGFSLVGVFPSSIAGGANDTFEVRLDASSAGTYSGTLSFYTNDSDENPYNFTITGEVVPLPTIEFSQATYQVNENGTPFGVSITLTRTADPLNRTSSVDVKLDDDTATGGTSPLAYPDDFDNTTQSISFNGSETSKTVTIPINDDNVDEDNETISLSLINPSTATLGTQSAASAEIVDNDPIPEISINDKSVNEGNSGTVTATFTVSLSSLSSKVVTVQYQTADGSATIGGSDYSSVGLTTLSFAALESSKDILITVNGDEISEGISENFYVNLSNPNNATIADNQGTCTITDDDSPGVTISKTSVAVTEGGATDSYTIRLNTVPVLAPPTASVTISFDTGTQITAIPPLTFNATNALTPQSVTVSAVNDTTAEGTHTATITHSVSNSGGDTNYTAAMSVNSVTATITDNDAKPQSIVFSLGNKAYGDSSFVGATATPSNYTVALTSSNKEVATVAGNRVTITGVGSTTICGNVGGDIYYTPATGCGTLTVSKKTLTVTADNKTRPYNSDNPPFTISYSGWVGSDNPGVLDTPPTISCSATKTSNGGEYSIVVSGGADNNYNFNYVNGTLTINKLSQSITGFESLPTLVNHGETVTLTATATSGLPVIFTSKDPAIVSVIGNKLTPVGYGNANICATQPGNTNYTAAQEVCQTVAVNSPPVIDEGKSVSVTMDEDGTPTAFGLTLHADDPDGSANSIQWGISKQASHGRASTSGTGSVKGIGYSPDTNWSGTDTFEVKAVDDRGGAATITVTVIVRGVNDAPVLDVSKSPALSPIEEDSINNGNTVAEILLDNPITDPDGTAVKAIAVTAVDNSHGYWQYSTNSGSTWNDFTDTRNQEVSFESHARLLDSQHRIRFVPNPDYPGGDCNFLKDENGYFICPEGYAEFTFRAYDKTSGNPGDTADVTQNGGTTAFSAFNDKAGISVEPVDDAPRLVNEIPDMEVLEDDPDFVINLRDVFTDPDNDDNLIEDSVKILGVRNVGPNPGSPLLSANIVGTRLEISYAAHQYGEADIEVWAESNGKTVSDSFTIIIHSLQDPPVIPIQQFPVMDAIDEDDFDSPGNSVDELLTGIFVTKNGYTYLDCETYDGRCVKYKGFITDPDAPNAAPVRAIAVIAVNNNFGKWQYSLDDGTTWKDFSPTVGRYVFMDEAARILETTHRIRFVPNPDYYGEAAFVFRAWDQSDDSIAGETADVSNLDSVTAFSEITDYGTIRVIAVDDVPRVTAPVGDIVVNRNADTMEIDLSNIFTDSDSDPAAISKYVRHNSDPTLLTATVTGENTLTLDFAENRHGTAVIELIAQSGGEEIRYSFTVVVTEEASDDNPDPALPPRYPGFTAIDEDEFDNEGNTVAEVLEKTALTDPDGEPVEAIVVTVVNNGSGVWQYAENTEEKKWQDFTEKPGDNVELKDEARLLDKTYRIRFVPDPDAYGDSTIRFRPWDQQTGIAGQTIASFAKDSDTDFEVSEPAIIAGIRVNEIDDPPMVENPIGYIAVKEATTPKVIDLSNVFTDVDSDPRKITKSLESNTNEDIVRAEVEGNTLTLEFHSENRGTALITVRAESEGQFVSDTFIVTINNAPELDATQSAGLTDIEEDDFENPGDRVADILAEKAITDPDGDPQKAIAVTAVDNTNGLWQYSVDAGKTWENFTLKTGIVSFESRAILLGSTDRIRFVPNPDYAGDSVFIFRAWDMSIGEIGRAMTLERVGGSEPFSSATDEAGIRVLSVDDPLVRIGSIDNVAVDENADDVIIDLSDIFSDPDAPERIIKTVEDNSNSALVSAKIEGDTLTLSFEEGGYGTAEIIILAESNGQTVSESFSVVVRRTSNYAPILDTAQSPALAAIYENDADNFGNRVADIVVNGSIADIDVEGDSVKAIAVIGADNANGIWQYSTDNGTNWYDISPVIGKFVDMETAALLLDGTLTGNDTQRIRFVPNPGFAGIASIRFRAWDKNQGEAGGLADASINGGQTAFSTNWDEAAITVKAISPCNQGIEKGDINGDGAVDLSDLILSLKAAAGIGHRAVCVYGDVNGDGKIGLEEAVYILNVVLDA